MRVFALRETAYLERMNWDRTQNRLSNVHKHLSHTLFTRNTVRSSATSSGGDEGHVCIFRKTTLGCIEADLCKYTY